MVYFKVRKNNGEELDFDKKCDRVDMSPAETFVYFGQSAEMDNGETGQIIHAIIHSDHISEITRVEEVEPANVDEEAEKPKKTAKKK